MLGDKLVITDYHRAAAARAFPAVTAKLDSGIATVAVSVAGESGCGKSETAQCLAELLEQAGRTTLILAQDDYFRLPPRTNHARRVADLSWVGPGEVRLDLLARHIERLKTRPATGLKKPLIDFDADAIISERVEPGRRDVVIAEGTYTTLLPDLDVRVFIDRNYRQTKKARLRRARDPDDVFFEKVLEIEHREISRHRSLADVIVAPPADEVG